MAQHELHKKYNNKEIVSDKHKLEAIAAIQEFIVNDYFDTTDMLKYLIHVGAINYIAFGKTITEALKGIQKSRDGANILIDGLIYVMSQFAAIYVKVQDKLGILFQGKVSELLNFKNDRLAMVMADTSLNDNEIILYLQQLLIEKQKHHQRNNVVVELNDGGIHFAAMSVIRMKAYHRSRDYRMQLLVRYTSQMGNNYNNSNKNNNFSQFNNNNNNRRGQNGRNNNGFNTNNGFGRNQNQNGNINVGSLPFNENSNFGGFGGYNNDYNNNKKRKLNNGNSFGNPNGGTFNNNRNRKNRNMPLNNNNNRNNHFNNNGFNNKEGNSQTSGHPIWSNHINQRIENFGNPNNPNNPLNVTNSSNNRNGTLGSSKSFGNFKDNMYLNPQLLPGIENKDICRHFNRGTCNRAQCNYAHVCKGCGSRLHGLNECPNKNFH